MHDHRLRQGHFFLREVRSELSKWFVEVGGDGGAQQEGQLVAVDAGHFAVLRLPLSTTTVISHLKEGEHT